MAVFPAITGYDSTAEPQFTSSGVPFQYLFDGYSEQFTFRASNSYIRARVAWDDAGQFLEDALGFTTGTAGQAYFNRQLPLDHPMIDDMWCTDAKLLSTPSSSLATANLPDNYYLAGGFKADWAVYGLTFTKMPYMMLENSAIAELSATYAAAELCRYTIITRRPRAREFTVKSFGLCEEGNTTNVLPIPAFVMDREQDIVINLTQVPSWLYPNDAIDNCLGRINSEAIQLPVIPEQGVTFQPAQSTTYAAQTLLFRGLAQDITLYNGPGAQLYYDLPFLFTYRPTTWRKLPNPSGTGDPITVVFKNIAPTKYLYDTQAFAALFKPST